MGQITNIKLHIVTDIKVNRHVETAKTTTRVTTGVYKECAPNLPTDNLPWKTVRERATCAGATGTPTTSPTATDTITTTTTSRRFVRTETPVAASGRSIVSSIRNITSS